MNNAKSQSKSDLRREMKLVLANLDQRWLAKAHSEVCHNLIELIVSHNDQESVNTLSNRHILVWIPCFPGEVDLRGFIATMMKNSKIYLPRIDRNSRMEFVRIGEDWESYLERGERKIAQPVDGYGEPFVVPDSGSVYVITPGLAFDRDGRRLGRGGGFYDRFLATPELQQRAIKIAVCWSVQIVQCVPTDHYDIAVDMICFERGVLRVGSDES
jgi:5-formyltetrahydrofolate cyclo-ligase